MILHNFDRLVDSDILVKFKRVKTNLDRWVFKTCSLKPLLLG